MNGDALVLAERVALAEVADGDIPALRNGDALTSIDPDTLASYDRDAVTPTGDAIASADRDVSASNTDASAPAAEKRKIPAVVGGDVSAIVDGDASAQNRDAPTHVDKN